MGSPSGGSTSSSFSGLNPFGVQSYQDINALIKNMMGTQAPSTALTGQGTTALNSGVNSLMGSGSTLQNYISQILGGSAMNPLANPGTQPTLDLYNKNYTTGLNQGVDALNALFQRAGQGSSGTESGEASNFARGALTDYQNNVGSLLGGLFNTGVQQTESAAGMAGMPGQMDLAALGASQIPSQLNLEQFGLQQQLNQAPISDLMSLLGAGGTFSSSQSQTDNPAWWLSMLPSFNFDFGNKPA